MPSTSQSTPAAHLLSISTTVLNQGLDLVVNCLRSDENLVYESKFLPGSTIGKHLRHTIQHFTLLLDCMSSPPPHIMSYDIRQRNNLMERTREAAREELSELLTRLDDAVPGTDLNQRITLHALTPHEQELETTFGRELWFAALHAVHHFSMIRVIAGELNIDVVDEFGFAPSTLLHRGSKAGDHEGISSRSRL